MIVSASRRTDIPAFYSDWFFNRIRDGYVMVRNPMNIHQVSRISLSSDVVDCIVFWTKNAERMLNRLHLLTAYNFYFQFTITPYGQNLEPNVPPKEDVILQFRTLSKLIGKSRVIWRYDPILLTSDIDFLYHDQYFRYIASNLAGSTSRCVISFIDLYKKCSRNLSSLKIVNLARKDMRTIAKSLSKIAREYGIQIVSCAEDIDLSGMGIEHGKCIDDKLISEISGQELDIQKDKSQRRECGCVASVDIGAYNTCSHGCLYCYANFDCNMVKHNLSQHRVDSPLISGVMGPKDTVIDKKVLSCFRIQQNLFQKRVGKEIITP